MCGICGLLSFGDAPAPAVLIAMSDAIAHRGPDADGHWHDAEAGIALGHRRLAIQDLSAAGAQPMASACRRWVTVFNGEIYNHTALRAELERAGAAPGWRGHSDTETLLAAIAHWGPVEALRRAQGMFALALWDSASRRLMLARDRMGEKPLYYTRTATGWAFGSELRAFLPVPGFTPQLNPAAIGAYLEYGYVPEGLCIYAGVSKVPPGHYVTLGETGSETDFHQTFPELVETGLAARTPGADEDELLSRAEDCLTKVIESQAISDVPLGAFLSGGVDSSLITALMQVDSATQVQSFSIGFKESHFNEAPYAAAVARHLGTAHTEFILSQQDALALVPDLPDIYDEPFADSSQIPTALLCREARRAVTVALSGDGGDEVFGGYNRHVLGPGLWRRAERIPRRARRAGAAVLALTEPLILAENGIARRLARRLDLPLTTVDKLTQLAPVLAGARTFEDFYRGFTTTFPDPSRVLSAGLPGLSPTPALGPLSGRLGPDETMMAWDSLAYLPGDILVKVDRAAMHHSLETRAPFLDARVVEMAWSLPQSMKIRNGRGKHVLRRILDRYVPRDLIDRPKQGFSIPIDLWLRGALRGWAEALIGRDDLVARTGLDPRAVGALWQAHLRGRANHGQKLWTLLMLLAWIERNPVEPQPAATADV